MSVLDSLTQIMSQYRAVGACFFFFLIEALPVKRLESYSWHLLDLPFTDNPLCQLASEWISHPSWRSGP